MTLFDEPINKNVLPYDGDVQYLGKIFSQAEADTYYRRLMSTIAWKNDEVIIFGKHIVTDRKVAWYGDKAHQYKYSGITREGLLFTDDLLHIKTIVENISKETFNSCLLNLYENGGQAMGWHSDDEKSLGEKNVIASVTFGAERSFSFKHKQTKEKAALYLENGSLLIMKGETQKHWLHSLPKSTKITTPRINLTFRTIKN